MRLTFRIKTRVNFWPRTEVSC